MSGRSVDIVFRKWLSRPHWRFSMYHLGDDDWGTWLWTPPGSTAKRAADPPKTFDHLNVKLVVPGQWWTAIWNDSRRYDLYIDVVTPPAWEDGRVTMIDLDLDLVRLEDGSVLIEDEDEFALHQVAYGYPDAVVPKARETADDLQRRLLAGEEPFHEVGAARMRQAAELVAGSR